MKLVKYFKYLEIMFLYTTRLYHVLRKSGKICLKMKRDICLNPLLNIFETKRAVNFLYKYQLRNEKIEHIKAQQNWESHFDLNNLNLNKNWYFPELLLSGPRFFSFIE
mgnify:CR=1 FL=1